MNLNAAHCRDERVGRRGGTGWRSFQQRFEPRYQLAFRSTWRWRARTGPRRHWGDEASDTLATVREFPVIADEAFTGLLGEIVRSIEPHTESEPVGLLLSGHAFFGNCIGRGPHYRVESTEHGTDLFVLKVGDSAKVRKLALGFESVEAMRDVIDTLSTPVGASQVHHRGSGTAQPVALYIVPKPPATH